MIVRFRTRSLQRAAEDTPEAARRWGPQVGPRYVQRVRALGDMSEWPDAFTIRSWRVHPIRERRGSHAIVLTGRWRMEVTPNQPGNEVMIEEVNNHYGD